MLGFVIMEIRPELPSDAAAIRDIHRLAFGQNAEADLVDALRKEGAYPPDLSLVAVRDGEVVGHILFSLLYVLESKSDLRAVALAPVGVLPALQGQGIGAALIRAGLKQAKNGGNHLAVVLGDPAYYTRFGFSREPGSKIHCPYSGPHLMALELVPGALSGIDRLEVRYARAFGAG